MNLILQDVEENYTVRIKVERTKLVHSTRVVQPDALPGAAEGEPMSPQESWKTRDACSGMGEMQVLSEAFQ